MSIWELLLLKNKIHEIKWKILDELQSHEYMGVIATEQNTSISWKMTDVVAIPWVYGSYCYATGSYPSPWGTVKRTLQSHEYMGVIATFVWIDEYLITQGFIELQSHEYMGVIATFGKPLRKSMKRNRKRCNPMSIWELLLQLAENLRQSVRLLKVAIPWVYGSYCYRKDTI